MHTNGLQRRLALLEPRSVYVPEQRLQAAWKETLWKAPRRSTCGERVRVLCPGRQNFSDGPDFRGARVFVGKRLYAGDIEIHRYVRDWYSHGHHRDPRYDACVLHVVFHAPGADMRVRCAGGRRLPVCHIPLEEVLQLPHKFSCRIFRAPAVPYFRILEACGWRRVREKVRYFYGCAARLPADVILYRGIFKACGYRYNESNMLRLFMSFPWEDYACGRLKAGSIAPALRDLAGFGKGPAVDPAIRWSHCRTRPPQFPERRVRFLGYLLEKHYRSHAAATLYGALSERERWEQVFRGFLGTDGDRRPAGAPGTPIRREIVLNDLLPLMEALSLEKKDRDMRRKIRQYTGQSRLPGAYGVVNAFHDRHGIATDHPGRRRWICAQGVLYVHDNFCSQDLRECCPVCGMNHKNESGG